MAFDPLNFSSNFVNTALNPKPQQPYQPASFTNNFVQQALGGNVQGAQSTGNNFNYSTPAPSASVQQPSQVSNSINSIYDQQRNNINSGYDSYFSQLDSMLGGLDPQRQAQEQIVNNNYNQSYNDLNSSYTQGQADLNTQLRKTDENTSKTLTDLTGNIRNQIMAGQIYLGARGAGDSSAGNQYSYALTKMGNQARGDVLSQRSNIYSDIGDRQSKLNNIFTQEVGRLNTEKNNGIQQIAAWFADAQNQVRSMKASGQLNRQQDLNNLSSQILNNALSQLNQLNTRISSTYTSLQQWAMNNSQNTQQLQQNLGTVSNVIAPQIQAQAINGIPNYSGNAGNFGPAVGYGSTDQRYDLMGQPIV